MEDKIDFVLIWVDGGDKEWQRERNKYAGKDPEDFADYRFRDWENLKYWFRGVEKFAPWVNNVYFITCGHYPKWLNLNHPKLKFVKHEDYIPKEYLPTFSSHTIELNLHRIKELSDKFVYFNDDTFLTNTVEKKDFFENEKPKMIAGLSAIITENNIYNHILLNDIFVINKYFDKKDVIKSNFYNWFRLRYGLKTLAQTISLMPFNRFQALKILHVASPILKNTMDELWKKESEVLENTSKNRFRGPTDINQYLFSWYDIVRGNFKPAKNKDSKLFTITDNNEKIKNAIKNKKYKMICLNDATMDFDFQNAKEEIIEAFEVILPEKSGFEI